MNTAKRKLAARAANCKQGIEGGRRVEGEKRVEKKNEKGGGGKKRAMRNLRDNENWKRVNRERALCYSKVYCIEIASCRILRSMKSLFL